MFQYPIKPKSITTRIVCEHNVYSLVPNIPVCIYIDQK